MTGKSASTVEEYLAGLPQDRRDVVAQVRSMVLANLPKGYRETFAWGMISYEVPLERYADTYNKKPLCYVALAAQKNYYALYLMGAYAKPGQPEALADAFARAGRKLDMGKSCLRFKKPEDLPLEAIGRIIADIPPDEMIAFARSARGK
jgi:uncharacterized protein YdhG (YjbR/CyaY superfamily)